MQKSSSHQPRRFWTTISDEQLIDLNLQIDNPETLPGLIQEVPDNFQDAHVEFKYDLRGDDLAPLFSCVHGHHKHKAGFVMKLGDARFMVGHICAKSIYGEDFDQYTADIDAAITRQDALRRVRELRDAVRPFDEWLRQLAESETVKAWQRLRGQLDSHMPFIFDGLTGYAQLDPRISGAVLPKWLCRASYDLRHQISGLLGEIEKVNQHLGREPEKAAGMIGQLRSRMDGVANRTETVIEILKEIEVFFQPAALDAICKWANVHDNPKRRTYGCGLASISVKNDKGHKTLIPMPKAYAPPSQREIKAFKQAISGGKSSAAPAKLIA